MRVWGVPLLCFLLGLSQGCDDLGESFEYRGGRLLDEGDYHVAAAHWLDTLPVVFASRAEGPDGERVLRFVPLSDIGIEPCSTMAGTGFIAVGRDGAFRMAVINDRDPGRMLDFFDARCNRVGPAFEDAIHIDYIADSQFLVRTENREAYVVEPFEGRVDLIAEDVVSIGTPRIGARDQQANPPPLALWVLSDDGLRLHDMHGKALSERIEGVTRMTVYHGPTAVDEGLMAYTDSEGVHLVQYDLDAARIPGAMVELQEHWSVAGACTQSFKDIDDFSELECDDDDDCEPAADPALASGLHAWLSMFRPCSARRLVLRRVLDSASYTFDDNVMQFKVAARGSAEGPAVFYSKSNSDGERDYFYRSGLKAPIEIEVPVDLQLLVEDVNAYPRVRMTTAEDTPRFGLWHPDSGFEPLLENVRGTPETSLVLHDYDEEAGVGTLSVCDESCAQIASDVRRGGYRRYTTLERIGDGPIVLAYIHDYQRPEGRSTGGGTLTVVNTKTGAVVDLDREVSSFVQIENGPARGIVYSVSDPERQGLWFAPR